MERIVERTLVKSQPELWQLVDQPRRMQGWISALLGAAAEIEITEREPERRLAWEASVADEAASIAVALDEKGWGTRVSIVAERDPGGGPELEGWIEAVLDELAAPEKRPFQNV